MILTSRHLSRRTLLRGLGAAIALPMLDAMSPAFAATARTGKPPVRLAFVYVPNGIVMDRVDARGRRRSVRVDSRILAPLEPHRENLMVLSGLTQNTGRARRWPGRSRPRRRHFPHRRRIPRRPPAPTFACGVSVDQVAAQTRSAHATRFASLELGCEDGRLVGNCDSGYQLRLQNTISWRTASTPMPPEVNPRAVFERLFGAEPRTRRGPRAPRASLSKAFSTSFSRTHGGSAASSAPPTAASWTSTSTAVREIERRIQMAEHG